MVATINVAAGIVWKKGQFLAAKRPETTKRGGYWEFPGGKQERGETIENTLSRELKEEIGIDCVAVQTHAKIYHEYEDLHVYLHFMHVTCYEGIPEAKEGQELRWVTAEEAKTMNFLPADIKILEELKMPDTVVCER